MTYIYHYVHLPMTYIYQYVHLPMTYTYQYVHLPMTYTYNYVHLPTLHDAGESHNSAHSLSSTDSSGASLVLARQGLKIQGALLPSAQTPQPTGMTDFSCCGSVLRNLLVKQ